LKLIKSAKKEIMLLLPTLHVTLEQERLGLIQLLLNRAKEDGIKIRILMPDNKSIESIAEALKLQTHIDVRFIEQTADTKGIFLIVDRKVSLVIGLGEDSDAANYSVETNRSNVAYSNREAYVLSYVAAFENLWTQTDSYQKIKVDNKMKEEFINIAAHELRTPIHPILLLADILHSRITDSDQRKMLDAIIRNAKRLQRLAEDILDVTRIETHSLKLHNERFNLNDLILDIVNEYKNDLIKKDDSDRGEVTLISSGMDDMEIFVEADKGRLAQIISNILDNAIKFTREGTVSITLQRNDHNEVQISIKDTGTGIEPQVSSKLFSKFATASDTGTGLGLFISKSLIESHGGKIWAENNENGCGATFHFTLPVIDEQDLENIEVKQLKNKKRFKVLVVDDDSNYSELLKTGLEHNGYSVDTFNVPQLALEKFISGFYNVAVLDIDMPNINGFELCQEIKKRDKKIKVCFLISGGMHYEAFRELHGLSDKDRFIEKSKENENIIKQLNALVQQHK
jgi:two-component system sensor histidine kinase VicK